MSEQDIVFDRTDDLVSGVVHRIAPGVRRLLAHNSGPFTFKGTVSYIVGDGQVAIIDPGPADQRHIEALLDAVRAETVTHILVTHTHRDHSPAAAVVKARTGAVIVAEGVHRPARPLLADERQRLDLSGDLEFQPDVTIKNGEVVNGPAWTLEALATPGHTVNHMAFVLRERELLFSGDHVMAWSTSIVAPPDGAMRDYMASLERIGRRPERSYLPGHGGPVRNAPVFVKQLIRHRQAREQSIWHRLGKGPADIPSIVRAVYIGLDPQLFSAACLSVLAHLEDLVSRGLVTTDGPLALNGIYRRAAG